MCWSRSRRPSLTAERPELATSITEQARALANEWKELDAEARRPFEAEAEDLRKGYVAAKADYDARHRDAAVTNLLRRKLPIKRRKQSRKLSDDEISEEGSGDVSDDKNTQTRKCARFRDKVVQGIPASLTIVHHPPDTGKRRKMAVNKDIKDEQHEHPSRSDDTAVCAPKEALNLARMSLEEYLRYDKVQQEKLVNAKKQRALQKDLNGHVGDDELQLALALSASLAEADQGNKGASESSLPAESPSSTQPTTCAESPMEALPAVGMPSAAETPDVALPIHGTDAAGELMSD
jgi:hypothetical protein